MNKQESGGKHSKDIADPGCLPQPPAAAAATAITVTTGASLVSLSLSPFPPLTPAAMSSAVSLGWS